MAHNCKTNSLLLHTQLAIHIDIDIDRCLGGEIGVYLNEDLFD